MSVVRYIRFPAGEDQATLRSDLSAMAGSRRQCRIHCLSLLTICNCLLGKRSAKPREREQSPGMQGLLRHLSLEDILRLWDIDNIHEGTAFGDPNDIYHKIPKTVTSNTESRKISTMGFPSGDSEYAFSWNAPVYLILRLVAFSTFGLALIAISSFSINTYQLMFSGLSILDFADVHSITCSCLWLSANKGFCFFWCPFCWAVVLFWLFAASNLQGIF